MSDHPRFNQPGGPDHVDPSEANLCPEWIKTITKLGFTAVLVTMKFSKENLEKVGPGFEERLGADLAAAELGHFDSLQQGDPFKLFYYLHTKTLPAGLRFIKGELENMGLLKLCKIGTADPIEKVWRLWHPAWTAGQNES